jgi:hypothetical protein
LQDVRTVLEEDEVVIEAAADTTLAVEVVVVTEETMQVAKLESLQSDLRTTSTKMEQCTITQCNEEVVVVDKMAHDSEPVVAMECDALTQCGCAWHWEKLCIQHGLFGREREQCKILKRIAVMDSICWPPYSLIKGASV